MEASNFLLLLLSTVAPNTEPPDSQSATYTPPPEWNTYDSPSENSGNYGTLKPCIPNAPIMGDMRCPPNSHYERCGLACPETCFKYYCPMNCCTEGCFCDEGYVAGPHGACVSREQCPVYPSPEWAIQAEDSVSHPRECGPNEYLDCDTQKNCYNYQYDVPSPENCALDCVCIPPLVRGPAGDCIHPEQCPSTSLKAGVMRDWTICNFMRVINPEADCGLLGIKWCDPVVPVYCVDGYEGDSYQQVGDQVEDITEACFPDLKPQEPVECPPGEHFEECGPICFESCIEYDCPLKCCVSGCYCPEGYVRGPTSECIPKEQCPAERLSLSNHIADTSDPVPLACGSDEIISCHSYCQVNCSNYDSETDLCGEACLLGCICKPPKIRGPDGDCILPDQCHPQPLRQVRPPCNPVIPVDCVDGPEDESYEQVGDQDENLRENIVRNYLQKKDQMEQQFSNEPQMEGSFFKCRGENEYLNFCSSPCPDTCDNYQDASRMCRKVCLPIPKCDCEEGYVRGPSGHCITPEECPNEAKTPEDCTGLEYYDPCGSPCEADCTTHLETNKACEDKRCKAGCFCKEGLVRGPDGSCTWPFECFDRSPEIPKGHQTTLVSENNDECPIDAEWNSCVIECVEGCATYGEGAPCVEICSQQCCHRRKKPLVRAPDARFSSIGKFPMTLRDRPEDCSELETFDECGSYCETDCFNFNMATRECHSKECRRGCFCKPGWVRSPDMKCVRPYECPRRSRDVGISENNDECPIDAEWNSCVIECVEGCATYGEGAPCVEICSEQCCHRRKKPLVRVPDARCSSTDKCPTTLRANPSCPNNEYFDECNANCELNCTNYDQNIACSSECKGGCVCKPPLVRGPDNFNCVEVEECRETRIGGSAFVKSVSQFPAYNCKENERFTFCKSICPDNCNNYNEERFCRHICLPGCTCLPGYVLSRDGVCIKKEHCVEDRPEDCSELETFDECGSYCETDCFNFNMATRECHSKECRRGCFCKPGWVRSPDMKCVRPYECPRRSRDVGREWPM